MKYLVFLILLLALPALALAEDTTFVPLTNIPQLTALGTSGFSLDAFLNGLYRLAIGAAAVVAVLQIMRAGIMYMGGDSVTEKKEAKNLIGLAIGGLILVLSPVVVFSVINPEILSLKIGGIDELSTKDRKATICTPACTDGKICEGGFCVAPLGDGSCSATCPTGKVCKSGSCVAPAAGTCPVIADKASLPTISSQTCCAAQSGCKVQVSGTDALAAPTCACSAPAAAKYGWRGAFENAQGTRSTQQQGPFASKALCENSLRDWPGANGLASTGEFSCSCGTPVTEQPSCTGF